MDIFHSHARPICGIDCYICMILATLHTLVAGVLVILILIGMTAILVGMSRVVSPWRDSTDADTRQLRRDVAHRDEVISSESLFRQFLARDARANHQRMKFRPSTVRQHHGKS